MKGSIHVVRALKLVIEQVPDARLMVIGQSVGKSCQEMLEEARKLGVEQRIVFTGWITGEELKKAYYLADVVVTPAIYPVPFPTVNLEAMACKKPLVVTCFGGSPELVQDGISGYVVNPYDVKVMAEKIIYLLKNPEVAKRMGLAGYQRVQENFSLEKQVQEILDWYKRFLHNTGKKAVNKDKVSGAGLKILILSDGFPPQGLGGAEMIASNLAERFNKNGHQVSVITTCREKKDEGAVDYHGFKIFRIYANYHERWRAYLSLYNPQTASRVKELIRKINPDVVHAHNVHYYLSYHSLKIAKKLGKPVFLTAHDMMLYGYGKPDYSIDPKDLSIPANFSRKVSCLDLIRQAKKRYNPFRNVIIRHYLKYVDKIFAVNADLEKALRENGIKNIELVYNGIDVKDWELSSN